MDITSDRKILNMVEHCHLEFTPNSDQQLQYPKPSIAKRTKSKNRMQITEFPARLSQHKRVLREIQGMWAEVFVSQVF